MHSTVCIEGKRIRGKLLQCLTAIQKNMNLLRAEGISIKEQRQPVTQGSDQQRAKCEYTAVQFII